ncbi:MAG TPA: protein translocase subunit SecF [Anaerolineaceae bacterium]|mgnify:CR=1 FL=1|nr:protein translocase subunit SecF [Anaerolineaceae bacterium]
MNILGKRYFFFALSLIIIVPGLILLAVNGLPLSIDFKGGSLLEIQIDNGTLPSTEAIKKIYDQNAITDVQVQTTSEGTLVLRSSALPDETRTAILKSIEETSGSSITILKSDTVGPSIGQGVTQRAIQAVALAALAVVIYITFAFRGVAHAFRYGICAIIAMIHDVLIVLALTGYGALFFGWSVDSLYLTALLTVIGFSVQDKIVVFDRIRENSRVYRKLEFEKLANHSIIQTLQRSINTQLMTVEFLLLSLALFGGVTLREFAVILLVGLLSGTYSSIFIAAPLLVVWENKEWKNWFHKKQTSAA